MDYYNVSLHGFFLWIFFFFFFFFSKWSLSILFFSYWADWEFYFVVFFLNTVDCYNVSHMVFVLLQCFPTCFFFKTIFVYFFFNIELIENLALTFPTCFFFHFFSKIVFFFSFFVFFFSELFLLIYFFNMELIENLAVKPLGEKS